MSEYKTALRAYISKTAQWIFFLLQNFNKQDKMQLLAKFKKNSVHGVQSYLKFSKSSGGSEPHVQNLFKFYQKLHLILLIKIL